MKKRKILGKEGFSLGLSALLGGALALSALWIANGMISRSKTVNYTNLMEDVYTLAETGLSVAVSTLSYNPAGCAEPWFSSERTVGPGQTYRNTCAQRNIGPRCPDCYYIVTYATKTVQGRSYSQELHSYVEVSNVAEYFAAVNDELRVAAHRDITGGKVYAPRLVFERDGAPTTKLYKAEFVSSVDPALEPDGAWDASVFNDIEITTPANRSPVQLSYPKLFPQMTDEDMEWYSDLAGPHRICNIDWETLAPPGYCGARVPGDTYGNHTNDNRHKVYYCDGAMTVGRLVGVDPGTITVRGQVFLVAEGSITIKNHIVASMDLSYPGIGCGGNASRANQLVLIPGRNRSVYIDNSFHRPVPPAPQVQTQNIHALIMATTGTLEALQYNPVAHSQLRLDFKGSMILGSSPNTLGTVFANTVNPTRYSYDTTLSAEPPPYLPRLQLVYHQFSRVTGESGPNQ